MWVLHRDTFLSCKTSQWVDRMSCSDIKRHIEQLTMSMPRSLSLSGILRAVESERQCERRKCQWHNDNDNYNDSEHNAKGRTSWRVNLCGPMRKPKSFASFTCSVLPLGMWVFVCVCTSVLAAETAQRMPRTWRDIESQMPDRKGRQARTCTCMPTPQIKLRKI